MDMSLSKLQSWWWTGKPGVLQSIGSQSWTGLSDQATQLLSIMGFCHQWEVCIHPHLSKFLSLFCFVKRLHIWDLPPRHFAGFPVPPKTIKLLWNILLTRFGWMLLFHLFAFLVIQLLCSSPETKVSASDSLVKFSHPRMRSKTLMGKKYI